MSLAASSCAKSSKSSAVIAWMLYRIQRFFIPPSHFVANATRMSSNDDSSNSMVGTRAPEVVAAAAAAAAVAVAASSAAAAAAAAAARGVGGPALVAHS